MSSLIGTKSQENQQAITQLHSYLNQRIIGQSALTTRIIIGLLADGHLLVEGAPGLAKTTAIKECARCISANFQRIQFTPDLLPADITGTEIFRPQTGEFVFQAGPIFHNLLLADEINRAPAKVQSALLEAMGERQVTVAGVTYELPALFMVMATQNPIEQEGTYTLPEAQLDRFLMHIKIDYPDIEAERKILKLNLDMIAHELQGQTLKAPTLSVETILQARKDLFAMHVSEALEEYIVQLIVATRSPQLYSQECAQWLDFGASPRATIGLERAARAHAWLAGRDYVSPEDIHAIAPDVLRHRLILNYAALAEGISSDFVINKLLQLVPVP